MTIPLSVCVNSFAWITTLGTIGQCPNPPLWWHSDVLLSCYRLAPRTSPKILTLTSIILLG
ncbi:MAG: hypothetical protein MRERV_53c014 [Mycoplasmataceae bacterium RV_VA103A]|nr:MAG: hypothetical protein MRERV_53c014 [Mycoplasmataceae bacterium RV_VA103A]